MVRNVLELLVAGSLIALSGKCATCQISTIKTPAYAPEPISSAMQSPAYEVATIKPPAPTEYANPIYTYIQSAFGIPANSTGWVFGPDWIKSAKYVIRAKPPDSIEEAMQTMTVEEKRTQIHLMMRDLLADRFKLKAHFETRTMQVYKLVVANGGPKLQENPDSAHAQISVGASMMRGKAASTQRMLEMLESVPDVGGRVIVDETGLSGTYDFLLKWTPLDLPAMDSEGPTLFTAIEEQLGLKLVPAKEPGQVLVIDHIERPSEN